MEHCGLWAQVRLINTVKRVEEDEGQQPRSGCAGRAKVASMEVSFQHWSFRNGEMLVLRGIQECLL